ncbi:olfactory receptor 2T10-like [Pseudophryne corroboree]|uniref:olfactory receptor 2T10-like n=1 Tax=Pseudophryne corroboree TaxID=495146 RepID=UPI003081F7EF
MYFYFLAGGTEDTLIFIMAYDRYVAICDPLHYHHILNRKHCILLASGTWTVGFLNAFLITIQASRLFFCQSRTINQFFCEPKALINISCTGNEEFYIVIYLEFFIFGFFPGMFCFTSYIKIIRVILQIKSKEERKKAFSTCSSHLTVVILYYMAGLCAYMMPTSESSHVLKQVLTAVVAVVTPMINPLIYSLRNKDLNCSLLKLLGIHVNVKKV